VLISFRCDNTHGGHWLFLVLDGKFRQMNRNLTESIYGRSFIKFDVSYQASIYLAKRCQSRILFFRNRPIRGKKCLMRQCLWMDRQEMSNRSRGPLINASYQVYILPHRNKGKDRARFVHILRPKIYWKKCPPNSTNILSIKNSNILITCDVAHHF
jgi:hypothetical protein